MMSAASMPMRACHARSLFTSEHRPLARGLYSHVRQPFELYHQHVVAVHTLPLNMAPSNKKTCFVTVGATASFCSLIKSVLHLEFLEKLESQDYTDLLIQYGQDGEALFDSLITAARNSESGSVLNITGFALDKAGLKRYMTQAKGATGGREGVVISHAGTLFILKWVRMHQS